VASGADRTIRRGGSSPNNDGNIEFPVVWVNGDNASLTLGKPFMDADLQSFELFIDGGYLSSPPVQAHAPLAVVSGSLSKLIMYDKVTLQNNYNIGNVPDTSHYQNGAGVFIRCAAGLQELQPEFIMKGGTIRGNINDIQTPLCCGGGVLITGFGLFTMEGGVIANNTAQTSGGGIQIGGRGSFRKTGGIVYGKKAPLGLRNIAIRGNDTIVTIPITKGHAVCAATGGGPYYWFRNDTVTENEYLGFTGAPSGTNATVSERDNWDSSDKAFRRWLIAVILIALALGVCVYLIITKIFLKKRRAKIMHVADGAPDIDLSSFNLTDREYEICKLLLTDLTFKGIAATLGVANPTVSFHANNLYRKLGIGNRKELFVKLGGKLQPTGLSNKSIDMQQIVNETVQKIIESK
jgi:DNA-binding CsgD family transcriptional regulator